MKQKMLPAILAISAVLAAIFIAGQLHLNAAGTWEDRSRETAQYIQDKGTENIDQNRKGTVQDYRNRELSRPVPRFVMGISGGLEAREGFGSVSLIAPLGVQYGQFMMTFDIGLVYSNAKTLPKSNISTMDKILRTKMNGYIIEFDLPFKFSYSFLDLKTNIYTPYLSAGIGYAYRTYYMRSSATGVRISQEYSINSFTLNYGFGFLVRTSEDTRFNVGITGVSHFSSRTGTFDYDTTGVSILVGLLLIM
jgi:hypothetical protein